MSQSTSTLSLYGAMKKKVAWPFYYYYFPEGVCFFQSKRKEAMFQTYWIKFMEKYLKNIFFLLRKKKWIMQVIYHFDTEVFYALYLLRKYVAFM